MDYKLRIDPTIFTAASSNKDMKEAGSLKAHIYIGPINHETNTIVQYPSGQNLKAYGTNKYLMDITAIGMIMPEDALAKMSTRAFKFQIADLVMKNILEVSWISATNSGVLTVSGVLAI